MSKALVTLDVQHIAPGNGKAPGTITGIDVDSGRELQFKTWPDTISQFEAGKTVRFEWYLGKPWQGVQDMCVSQHGEVTPMPRAVGDGPVAPVEAPLAPRAAEEVSPPPRNTPQGVMGAAQGTRERSIVAQAIIKSVIGVVGTPADVQKWVDVHDAIVAGKRVD